MSGSAWSEEEVRGAVGAYFALLAKQQAGERPNKAEVYRALAERFSRSPKSFERKFQNISAVLFEQRLPYCDGLKPFHNHQRLLKLMVLDHLDRSPLPPVEPHEVLFSKLKGLGDVEVPGKGAGRYGLALEKALGIEPNSSKDADFMGIELKTKHGSTLQTLFSRAPSTFLSGGDRRSFFEEHASYDDKRCRPSLYTSFSSRPDTLGFSLGVDGHFVRAYRNGHAVLEYAAEQLEDALLSKHSQTAFVAVSSRKNDGPERMRIESVRYCKWPSILRFLTLVEEGAIFLDLTMSADGERVRDHGFLWRIRSDDIERLYLRTVSVA